MFTKDRLPADRRSDRNSSGYNHLKELKTPQDSGSAKYPTSLKPLSKYNILQSYFEWNFNADSSRSIAQEFNRQMKFSIPDSSHLEELRNKIIYLHKYNIKVAEISVTYPFSTELSELLLQYVLMESRTLYRRRYYTGRNEIKAQDRILRLLLGIYNAYFETKLVPAKKTFEKSAKAIINIFIEIRRDYGLNNALLENMTKILLKKMGHLEKIEALRGKSLPCPLDTCLKNDPVFEIYKNIATSDYGTDDGSTNGFQIDDEPDDIQIVSETAESSKETECANEEHPHSTDDIPQTLSRPMLTICLDYCGPGSDEEIACLAEEVKPTAKQEKKALERTQRLLAIQEENQKSARRMLYRIREEFRGRNHKPMVDVKGEDEKFDQFKKGKPCFRPQFSLDESVMISGRSPNQLDPSKKIPKLEIFEISDEDECADGNSVQTDITIDGSKRSSSNSIKIQSNKQDDVLIITSTDDEDVQAKDTSAIVEKREEEIYDSFTKELAGDIAGQLNSRQECTSETGISNELKICENNKYPPISSKPNDEAESSIIEIIDETISDLKTSEEDIIIVSIDSSDEDNIENSTFVGKSKTSTLLHTENSTSESEGKVDESPSSKNESSESLLQTNIILNDCIENLNSSSSEILKDIEHANIKSNDTHQVTTHEEASQEQIGTLMGISATSVSRIEDGIGGNYEDSPKDNNLVEVSTLSVDQPENVYLTCDDGNSQFEPFSTSEKAFSINPQDQVVASLGIQASSLSISDRIEDHRAESDNDSTFEKSAIDHQKNIDASGNTAQYSTVEDKESSIASLDQVETISKIEETEGKSNELPDDDLLYKSVNINLTTEDPSQLSTDKTYESIRAEATSTVSQDQDEIPDENHVTGIKHKTENPTITEDVSSQSFTEEFERTLTYCVSGEKSKSDVSGPSNILLGKPQTSDSSTEGELGEQQTHMKSTQLEPECAIDDSQSGTGIDVSIEAIPEEQVIVELTQKIHTEDNFTTNQEILTYLSDTKSPERTTESSSEDQSVLVDPFEDVSIAENSSGEFKKGKPQTSDSATEGELEEQQTHLKSIVLEPKCATNDFENEIGVDVTIEAISEEQVIVELSQEIHTEASFTKNQNILTPQSDTKSSERTTDSLSEDPIEDVSISENPSDEFKGKPQILNSVTEGEHKERQIHLKSTELEPKCATNDSQSETGIDVTIQEISEEQVIVELTQEIHTDTSFTKNQKILISQSDTKSSEKTTDSSSEDQSVLVDTFEDVLISENPSGEFKESKPQTSDSVIEGEPKEQQTHLKLTELKAKCAINDSQSETGIDVTRQEMSEEQVIVELNQEIHTDTSFTKNQKILISQSDTKSSERTTDSSSRGQPVLVDPFEDFSISENPSEEFKEGKPQILNSENTKCATNDSQGETGIDVTMQEIFEEQVIVELTQEIHTDTRFTKNQKILPSQSDAKSSEKTTDSLSEYRPLLEDPIEDVSISENPSGEFKESKPQTSDSVIEGEPKEEQTHMKSTELEAKCAINDAQSETGIDVTIQEISEEQVIVEPNQEIHTDTSFTKNQKILIFQSDTKSSERTTDSSSGGQPVLVDPFEDFSISENPSEEFKEGKPQILNSENTKCATNDSQSETGIDVTMQEIFEEQVIVELTQEIRTDTRFTKNQKILPSQSDAKSSEKTTDSLSEYRPLLEDPIEDVSISENPSGEFKESKPQTSDSVIEGEPKEEQTHMKSTELEAKCAINDAQSETGIDVTIQEISEEQVIVEPNQEIHTDTSFTKNQKILISQSDTKSSERTTDSSSEGQSVLVDPFEDFSISENPSEEFKEGKPQMLNSENTKCATNDSQSETGIDVTIQAISEEQVIVELTQEIHTEASFTTNQKILPSQSDAKSSEKTTDSLSEYRPLLEDPIEYVSISENPSGEFKESKPQTSDSVIEGEPKEQQTHWKSTELEAKCVINDSQSETGIDVTIQEISEEQVIVELTQETHTEASFTTNQKILPSQSDAKSSEKTTDSSSEDQSVLVDPLEDVSISENPSGEFKESKPQTSDSVIEGEPKEQQTHLKSTELEAKCAINDSQSETGTDVTLQEISEEQVIVELTQEIHTEASFTTNQKILPSQSDAKSFEKTTDSSSEDQSVLVDPLEDVSISENPSEEFKESKPQTSDSVIEGDPEEQQTHLKSTELEPKCAINDSQSETGIDVTIQEISEEQVIVELTQEIHTDTSFTKNQKILISQSDTKSSEKTTDSSSGDQSVLVDTFEDVLISENPSGEFKESKPQTSDSVIESESKEQLKSTELEPKCAINDSQSKTGMHVSIEAISEEQVIVELTQEIHTEDSFTTNQEILTSQSDTKSFERITDSSSEDHSILENSIENVSTNPIEEFLASKELSHDIPLPASHVEIDHSSETVFQGCFNIIIEESQLSIQVDAEEVSANDGENTTGPLQITSGDIYLDEHPTTEDNFHLDSSKDSTGEFTFEDTLINEVEIVSSSETISKGCTLSQVEEARSENKEMKENSGVEPTNIVNQFEDIAEINNVSQHRENNSKIGGTDVSTSMPRKDMKSTIHLYDSPEIHRIIEKYSNIPENVDNFGKRETLVRYKVSPVSEPLDLSISQSINRKNLIENNESSSTKGSDKKIVDDFSIPEAASTLLLLSVSEENKMSPRIETKTIRKRTVQRKKQTPKKFDGSKDINKRVTRSQTTTKPMHLSSFSPTDVLAIKSYSPANKIYTQKLSDSSFTSEESNDSESNKLMIDEDVCSKSAGKNQTVEAVQVKENKGSSIPESNIFSLQGEANITADTADDNQHFLIRPKTTVPATTSETEGKPSQFPVADQQLHISLSKSLDDLNNTFYSSRFKTPGQRKLYGTGPNLYVNIQRIAEHDSPINEKDLQTNAEVFEPDFNEFVIKNQPDDLQAIDVDELPLAERIRNEANIKHSKKCNKDIETAESLGISSSSNEHISVPIETYPVIQQHVQVVEQCDKQCDKQCDESKQSESEMKNYFSLPKLRDKRNPQRRKSSSVSENDDIWKSKKNTVSPTAEKLMKKLYNLESPLLIDTNVENISERSDVISDQTKTEKRSEGVKVLIVDETSGNDNQSKSLEVSASLEVSSICNLKKNEVELKFQTTKKIISSTVSTEKPRVDKLDVSPDNKIFTLGNNGCQNIEEKVRAPKDPVTTPRRKKGGRRKTVANSDLSSSKTLSDVISESVCQRICDSPTTKQKIKSNQLEKPMGQMEQNDPRSEITTENTEPVIPFSGPETCIVDEVVALDNIKEIGESKSSDQSQIKEDLDNNEPSIVKCRINLMALDEFGATKEEAHTSEKTRHKIELFKETFKTKFRKEQSNQLTVAENESSNSIESRKCDESKRKCLTSERKKSKLHSSKNTDEEKVSSASKSTSKSRENRNSEKTNLVETERNKKVHKSEEKKQCPITQHVNRKSQIKLENCSASMSDGESVSRRKNYTFSNHESLKKNDSKDKIEIITERKVETTKKDKSRRSSEVNEESNQFERFRDVELEAKIENKRSRNRREQICLPSRTVCEEIIVSDVIEDERREKKGRKSSSNSKSTPYQNKKVSLDKKSKKPVELSGSHRGKSRSKSTSGEDWINDKDIESCKTKILCSVSSTDEIITMKSDERCEERKRNPGLYSKAISYDQKEASSKKTKYSNPITRNKKDTRGSSNPESVNHSMEAGLLDHSESVTKIEDHQIPINEPGERVLSVNLTGSALSTPRLNKDSNSTSNIQKNEKSFETLEKELFETSIEKTNPGEEKCTPSNTNSSSRSHSHTKNELKGSSTEGKSLSTVSKDLNNCQSSMTDEAKISKISRLNNQTFIEIVSSSVDIISGKTSENELKTVDCDVHLITHSVSSTDDLNEIKLSSDLDSGENKSKLLSSELSSVDSITGKVPAERIEGNSVHPNIQNESENIYKLPEDEYNESSQISSSLSGSRVQISPGNDNQEIDDNIVLAKFQTEPLMEVQLTNISSPISHSSTNEEQEESSSRMPDESNSEYLIVHDEESRPISSTKIESPTSSTDFTIHETPAKQESNTLSKHSQPTSTDDDRHSEVSEMNASNTSSFDSQDVETPSISKRSIKEMANLHLKSQCKRDRNEQKSISISRSRTDKNMKRKTNERSSELVVDNEEYREIFPETPYKKNIEVAYSFAAESIEKHSENIIEELIDGRDEVVEKHEDSDMISIKDPLSQRKHVGEKNMKKRKSMNVYEENVSRPILVEEQEVGNSELQNVRTLGLDEFTEGSHINTENNINMSNKKLKISPEDFKDSISSMAENECITDKDNETSTAGFYSLNSKIDLQNESELHNENMNQSYISEKHPADSSELRISSENKETDYEQYRESLDTTLEKSFDTIHQETHGEIKQKEMPVDLLIQGTIPVCIQTETIVDEMKIGGSISKIENRLEPESVMKEAEAITNTQDDSTNRISSIVNQNKVAINQAECDNFDNKTIISKSTTKQTDSTTPEYSLISDNVNDSCKIPDEFHVNYAINLAENHINVVPDQSKELNGAVVAEISIIKTPSNAEEIINELDSDNRSRITEDSDVDLKTKEYVLDTFETRKLGSTSQMTECQRNIPEDFFKGRYSDTSDDVIERSVVDTDVNEIPIIMQVNPTKSFKCSTLPISFEKRDIDSFENLLNRSKEEGNVGRESSVEPESTVDFSELRDKNNFFTTISSINPGSTVGFLPFVRLDRQLKDTNSVTLDAATTDEKLQMEIGHTPSFCQLEPKEEIIKIDIPEIDSEVVISSDESSRLQSKEDLSPYYPSSSDAMPLRQLENCEQQMYVAQDKSLSDCFSCLPSTVLSAQSVSQGNKEVVPYLNLDRETAAKPTSSCINDPANLSDTCMSGFLDQVNETNSIRVQTSSVLQTSSLIPSTSQNSEFAANSRLSNMSSMASREVSIVSEITTITSRESMLVFNKQGKSVAEIPLDAVCTRQSMNQVQISRSSRFFSRVSGSRNEISGIPEGYHRLTEIKVSNDEDHTYSYNNTADPVIGGSIDGEDNYFPRSLTETTSELPPNDNPLPLEFRDLITDDYKLNEFNESTIKNLSMMATHLKEYDIFDVGSDKKDSEFTVEHSVNNSRYMGPWQQMIDNDDSQQKEVAVLNAQCSTPLFSITNNDANNSPDISKQAEDSKEELDCATEPSTSILPPDPWQRIIENDDCQQKVVVVPNVQFFPMPEESNYERELDCIPGSSINSLHAEPWQQIMEDKEKVLVETNDRCSTPIFNISHGDIFSSSRESGLDGEAKPEEINNETPSLSKESSTSVSPSDIKSSNADTKEQDHSSKDNSKKSDKPKKSQKREKCEPPSQDVLPIRKYSKTCPAKWIRNSNAVSNTKTQNLIKKDVPESISTDNLLKLPLSKAVANESIAKSETYKKYSSTVVKILDSSNLPESSPLISDASHPISSFTGKTNPSLCKNEAPQNPSPGEIINKKQHTSSLILNNILCPTSSPTTNSRDIKNFLAPHNKSNNIQIESSEETERKSTPKLYTTPLASSKKASPKVASIIDSSLSPKTSPLISDTSHPISSFPGKNIPSLCKNQDLQNTNTPEKVNQKGRTSSLLLNNISFSSTGRRDVRDVIAQRPKRPNSEDENPSETKTKRKKKTEETTKSASETEVSDLAMMDIAETVKLRRKRIATTMYSSCPDVKTPKPTNTKRKRTSPSSSSRNSISEPMVKTYQSREGPVTVTTESESPLRLRLKVGEKSAKTSPQPASRCPSDYSIDKILDTPDRDRMGTKRPSSGNAEKQQYRKTSDKFHDIKLKPSSRTEVVPSLSRDSASCRMEGDSQKGDYESRGSGSRRGYSYPIYTNESRNYEGRGSVSHRGYSYPIYTNERTNSSYYRNDSVRTGGMSQPTNYPGHNPSHPANAHRGHPPAHPKSYRSYHRAVPPQPPLWSGAGADQPPLRSGAGADQPRHHAKGGPKLPQKRKNRLQSKCLRFGPEQEEEPEWIEEINKRVDSSALDFTEWRDFGEQK